MRDKTSLVADLGGTNARFGLIGATDSQPKNGIKIKNDDYETFIEAVRAYLVNVGAGPIAQICLSIAAPIQGDIIPMTNCKWIIDLPAVKHAFTANTVTAINDFEALGLSLHRLPSGSAQHVSGPKQISVSQTKMIVGAGTGFNASVSVSPDQNGVHYALPAECGHMTLPIESELELSLRSFLAGKYQRASIERVLSGRGIVDVHEWVCAHFDLHQENLSAAEITSKAHAQTDAACEKTISIVTDIFARVVGDLALANLPIGGIYLYGGVTRALTPWIETVRFRDVFEAKGRQSNLMQNFPIHIIKDDDIALIGCAARILDKTISV